MYLRFFIVWFILFWLVLFIINMLVIFKMLVLMVWMLLLRLGIIIMMDVCVVWMMLILFWFMFMVFIKMMSKFMVSIIVIMLLVECDSLFSWLWVVMEWMNMLGSVVWFIIWIWLLRMVLLLNGDDGFIVMMFICLLSWWYWVMSWLINVDFLEFGLFVILMMCVLFVCGYRVFSVFWVFGARLLSKCMSLVLVCIFWFSIFWIKVRIWVDEFVVGLDVVIGAGVV